MLCSCLCFLLYICKTRSKTAQFSSWNVATCLRYTLPPGNLEGGTSSNMCWWWVHSPPSDVLWGFTMLNALSSHRCIACLSIYCFTCPTDCIPSCSTEPIWKCFQSYTVPISWLNIFNRMARTNGRKHKLLKINKWRARHFSALHPLFNPNYTTELTTFLPDIWGSSACSFTPVYSGIFNRLSVLWKGQCNFTLLLLHIHMANSFLCAPSQPVTAPDFRANSLNAIIQSLQLLHTLLWEYSEPSAVSTSRSAVPGSM